MKPNPTSRQKLGKLGETIAARYLHNHGYILIDHNFKARYGELDIIALKDKTTVIVEVKTRIGEAFGKPEEAITKYKLRELIKTSEYYSFLHPEYPTALRIDCIAISLHSDETLKYLRHIQNITS